MDMIAEELINHMIPPLKLSDDAHKAIMWMEEMRCNYLPVVDNSRFLGLINEEIILDNNDIEKLISEFDLIGKDAVVSEEIHFYEIIKKASDLKVQSVAVVDHQQNYLGVISLQDALSAFAQSAAVHTPGGIIVLSMSMRDYSLAEISRLIEENNVKIASSNMRADDLDPSMIKLTLKINSTEINRVVATLERFGYKIIARFQESNSGEAERDRLDMLFRYLEI